jgi:uncharacterized membrane protein YeaQ/YmgE (transglycosylase-associated protein family)
MVLLVVLIVILLLFLVGGLVIGLTLKLIGIAITGLIVGALARLVLPGPRALGWIGTVLYGIAGSLIGAIVGDILDVNAVVQFLLAIAAAAVLIALFAAAAPRRSEAP